MQSRIENQASRWTDQPIKTSYSSSYYDYGVLDTYDHFLELAYLRPYLRGSIAALDLAAGSGRFTEAIVEAGGSVDAVDLEEAHVSALRERFRGSKVCTHLADIRTYLKECSKRYDLIILSGCLLFFDDHEAELVILQMKQLLNPKGVIIVRDFFTEAKALRVESAVFQQTFLYYRNLSFYSKFGGCRAAISRPYHRFIGLEKWLARVLGFRVYRLLWKSQTIRRLSWFGQLGVNMMLVIPRES